jgi:hypothetical protein
VLEGKECSKVLECSAELEAMLPENLKQFARYLASFREVIKATFGLEVKDTWVGDIATMKTEFQKLKEAYPIQETPKVHLVFNHIHDYIQLTGKGLGEGSEQALEASHHAFKKVWERFWVKDSQSTAYMKNYLQAVITYNWMHI